MIHTPAHRTLELLDIAQPDIIGAECQQFRLRVQGAHPLAASLQALGLGGEQSIYRAHRGQGLVLIEECGLDRRRRHVGEALAVEHGEQPLPFGLVERQRRSRPGGGSTDHDAFSPTSCPIDLGARYTQALGRHGHG